MHMQTPRAPPPPVAAMLSPMLWQLNCPDRFDMYSAGVLLLQARMLAPADSFPLGIISFVPDPAPTAAQLFVAVLGTAQTAARTQCGISKGLKGPPRLREIFA
jgi:hypothetical protein